ncbi:MAG: hypothetical protein BA861_12935 [Desulfobacterales bacterium S3730MH5]|nr:MAG: hypothetical protein BA861_12935 [Desulfobacterales bacterium S3730MH5]
MPRIKLGGQQRSRPSDWRQAITDQLRSGKVLPIISNRLHDDLILGGHCQLVRAYAEYHAFPLDSNPDLPEVVQYNTVMRELAGSEDIVKREYLDFVKSRLLEISEKNDTTEDWARLQKVEESQFDDRDFSAMAANLCYPRFGSPVEDPLLILAGFDLPIYLTTSSHCFIEEALKEAGKQPRTAACCWHPRVTLLDKDPLADDYQPSVLEPLVYHLYGLDSCPESLVLSEDDFLSFLVNASRDRDLIPNRLRQALNDSSLMLLGYDLGSWDFRTLLYGLIKTRSYCLQSVCVLQLQPSKEEQAFLNRYMDDVDFKVFWGDFAAYLRQLHNDLQR